MTEPSEATNANVDGHVDSTGPSRGDVRNGKSNSNTNVKVDVNSLLAQSTTAEDEEDDDEDDSGHVWLPGQTVRIVGLSDQPEFNGKTATILEVPSTITPGIVRDANVPQREPSEHREENPEDEDKILVRVYLPNLRSAESRIRDVDMAMVREDEEQVSVIWTYNRRINTGQRGEYAEVMVDAFAADDDEDSSVREISCTVSELHEFISRMQFTRINVPILDRLNYHVACFANIPENEQQSQGKGKDNVIASQFTMSLEDGKPLKNIIGTCFFVRLHPSNNGQVVPFTHEEFIRVCMFLNDLTSIFQDVGGTGMSLVWETLIQCFPYYEIGCRMGKEGFMGLKSMFKTESGSFMKMPEDMELASTYRV